MLYAGAAAADHVLITDSVKIRTILFKISGPETQNISYLFGTHHAFGKSFFDSLQHATQALFSSEVLIKENLNIPGHSSEELINSRLEKTAWTKYLSKQDFQFVKNIYASSIIDINKMTPAELYASLTRYYKEKVCIAKDTTDSYLTLDDYIESVAQNYTLELVGLETTEEQIELINRDIQGMPRKVHKKRLSRLITRIRSNGTDHCSEINWYREMDFDYKFNQPCQNKLVLTDRNNKWMTNIKSYLETKKCFIAVGLSHLMFECGIINQLKELGYSITPIEVR